MLALRLDLASLVDLILLLWILVPAEQLNYFGFFKIVGKALPYLEYFNYALDPKQILINAFGEWRTEFAMLVVVILLIHMFQMWAIVTEDYAANSACAVLSFILLLFNSMFHSWEANLMFLTTTALSFWFTYMLKQVKNADKDADKEEGKASSGTLA